MPTPKNKFLEAVWNRIGHEREEYALYRKHTRDTEELPPEPKAPPVPPVPKIPRSLEPKLTQDQMAQITFLFWDHYAPVKIAERMQLSEAQVKRAIKEMRLEHNKRKRNGP